MTQSLPIAILLYIAAFLLGFFLLYLWRAKLSSRAYTQEISDLKQTLAEQQKRRTGAEEKHFHTESHHAKVHQELEEKEATQSALQAHEAALMERITELENEKERLEEKIREEESETLKVRSEIKKLSEERDAVNKEQARVDENAETLSRLDEKLSDLKSLTESYLREIEALDALREKFHEEASLL
ncbi:MAG TPA: hypothetical protein ENK93_00505, partial [Campylobacteraceae bacterium]|nr:hypothetical protein [Campylobacteraceae bacterium]